MATSSSNKSAVKTNLLGKREPQDDLETEPILRKHKGESEEKETTEGLADILQWVETNSDQTNLSSVEETVEGLGETPDFVEEVARKKILLADNFSPQTTISDIINFFKYVEGVVRVQVVVDQKGNHIGYGYVEFASANEAKKALLQNKSGEYLHDSRILLDVAYTGAKYFPPKFYVDHKFWAKEDYLGRESLPIGEDATFPNFVEDFSLRLTTIFVANLSPQSELRHIIRFFEFYGDLVSVRLIVNHEGKHVGYGFVEYYSAKAAWRAVREENGEYLHDHMIFLALATTFPDIPQTKYNLAEMFWYEDCLRREILPIEEDETPPVRREILPLEEDETPPLGREILPIEEDETPPYFVEEDVIREKTLYVSYLSPQTKLPDIINFFKDVGEVVHVRLSVDRQGRPVGHGFVEFASTNDAKKALEKKMHDGKIFVDVDMIDPYRPGPKCWIDHKIWYEDYLQQENLLIEEDKTMEGLVEEFAVQRKTLFLSKLAHRTEISDITRFFKGVGKVYRVRLIVNNMGEHVGCGFVDFATASDAKKALQKNGERLCGSKIYLDVAELAPYPLRPIKYNTAEKIWYKDYLLRKSCLIEKDDLETKPNRKKHKEKVIGIFSGKKTTFSEDD